MRALLVGAVAIVGTLSACPSLLPDDFKIESDAAAEAGADDAARDAREVPDSSIESSDDAGSDAGCRNWELGGVGVPPGTTVAASVEQLPAAMAIDGDLKTHWLGDYSAWLELRFPMPVFLNGLRLAAYASPAASESYTITSVASGATIGSATLAVPATADVTKPTVLPAIPVTPGSYAGIRISVNGGASWVNLHEVSLLTERCP
jgi:hypothetical protein